MISSEYKVKTVGILPNKAINVTVPGSKSITNRALLIAALADGKSTLKGVLFSDDSRVFLNCLMDLGFEVNIDQDKCEVTVKGCGGIIPKREADIYVGSAGTAARFLTAFLALEGGDYRIDSSEQMRKRPMKPLLDALAELGTDIVYEGEEGFFPFTLSSNSISKNSIEVDVEQSSQFLSALLMLAPLFEEDFTINVKGSHGMSYIGITLDIMREFGIEVLKITEKEYLIKKGQCYKAREYQIEPDVSAACYFYAMAPIIGADVVVKNVFWNSTQGDIQFIRTLEKLGCRSEVTSEGIKLFGIKDGKYNGIEVDMSHCSDQTMTMAAVAAFATSKTVIQNIGHIKYQESNRIQATINELTKMGINASEETEGNISIEPSEINGANIDTYDDHRMAMAFALIGLRAKEIVIRDPQCCRKTFENYFQMFDKLFCNEVEI